MAQEGSIWKRRVYHWRAAMEYFLIGMWRQCVALLDEYDVVGANNDPFTPVSRFRTVANTVILDFNRTKHSLAKREGMYAASAGSTVKWPEAPTRSATCRPRLRRILLILGPILDFALPVSRSLPVCAGGDRRSLRLGAGINVQGPPVAAAWHYSGNYWWSTGAYFATLPPDIGPDYYDPEKHLFLNRPRAALVWSTGLEGAGGPPSPRR